MRRISGLRLGFLLAAMCAAPALAQDDAGRASRDLEAQSLFEAGNVAFSDGRYEDALRHFRNAHELSGRPEMLFNIGTAAERMRHDAEALEAFESFLVEVPDAQHRRQIEARIVILQDSLAAAQRTAENAGTETETLRVDASANDVDRGGRNYTMAWVSGAAAVVFVGLGTAGRILGNNAYDDLLVQCSRGCTEESINASSVQRWDRLTIASFSLGALAVVGSVIGLVLAPESETEPVVRIGPSRISIEGRF